MLIPSLGCLTSKQKWNFLLFCIWLWAKCSCSLKASFIVMSWTQCPEPCIMRSSQPFQLYVYSAPSCWWSIHSKTPKSIWKFPWCGARHSRCRGECLFLILLLLIFYFLINQLVIAFLTLLRDYAGLNHSNISFIQIAWNLWGIFCVYQQEYLLHKYIPLNP